MAREHLTGSAVQRRACDEAGYTAYQRVAAVDLENVDWSWTGRCQARARPASWRNPRRWSSRKSSIRWPPPSACAVMTCVGGGETASRDAVKSQCLWREEAKAGREMLRDSCCVHPAWSETERCVTGCRPAQPSGKRDGSTTRPSARLARGAALPKRVPLQLLRKSFRETETAKVLPHAMGMPRPAGGKRCIPKIDSLWSRSIGQNGDPSKGLLPAARRVSSSSKRHEWRFPDSCHAVEAGARHTAAGLLRQARRRADARRCVWSTWAVCLSP